jgi:transposase
VECAEAEAIYEQGRDAVVSVLLALSEQNERLQAQVEQLTFRVARQDERIAVLERQLGRSSRNSSQPPSADPPAKGGPSRGTRRGKDLSGCSQGAQSGHAGRGRELLPASAVDEVVEYWPERCGCGHEFAPQELVAVGEPQRHQVEELPVISTIAIEYRARRVCCPGCGNTRRRSSPQRS